MSLELLVFEIDDAALAVPTTNVREVIRAVALFPLVEHPPIVEGGLNLRGEMIPVVDGRAILSQPSRPIAPNDHIIVLESDHQFVAIHVDRALELTKRDSTISADQQAGHLIQCVVNTQRGPAAIIDVRRLLAAAMNVTSPSTGSNA